MTRRRPSAELPGRNDRARARRIGKRLEQWFKAGGRSFPWRAEPDPYRVTVAEVLLQRTRAESVARIYDAFFSRFPSWSSLAVASTEELEQALAPVGLQRRRAASLSSLARIKCGEGVDPAHLPGIGQYIERAVAVSLNRAPVAMVDSNFVRLIRRAFAGTWRSDYRFDPRLQALASEVIAESDPQATNWAILDFGAKVCLPRNPLCASCPLLDLCVSGRDLRLRASTLQ